MADGSGVDTVSVALEQCVMAAMCEGVLFNTLRQHVAATAKVYGVDVLGTDRVDMNIVVTYRGGVVHVQELASYRRQAPLSMW